MVPSFKRARIAIIAVAAFVGGLILASSLDLTQRGFAQSRVPPAETRTLSEASEAFVTIAESVTPAVVSIQVESRRPQQARGQIRVPEGAVPPGFEEFFRQFEQNQPPTEAGGGSGFIVSKDGYILTNNHVVARGPQLDTPVERITVQLLNGQRYIARIVGRDPTTDVAVLKIEGNNFPTATLGDDANDRVGEWVLAIGNPLGLDFTVTAGIISAKGRSIIPRRIGEYTPSGYTISDLIQTDAAINMGNSGGPLVNRRGEVIGINNSLQSGTGFYAGYGFAVPISLAKKVMDDLIRHGRVRIAVIGVQIGEVTADDAAAARLDEVRGAQVQGFSMEDSPARRAGVQPGDIIISADGQRVDRQSTLQRIVRSHAPGETVRIEVMRFGQRRSFDVRLVEAPAAAAVAERGTESEDVAPAGTASTKLGISVTPVPAELATRARLTASQRGLLVTAVEPLGAAWRKLFEGADVIVEVISPTRRQIRTAADLQQVLGQVRSGQFVTLSVINVDARTGATLPRVVSIRIGG